MSGDQHIGQPPPEGFVTTNINVPTISEENSSNKYDASFEIKQPTIISDQHQQPETKPRRLSFKRHILGGNNSQQTTTSNINISSSNLVPPLPPTVISSTSPRIKSTDSSPRSSISPSSISSSFPKKPQPAHSLTLQLEDLLAASYKNRLITVEKFVFMIDFSFMENEDLYNIVKKAYISYIHAKNQSSWNFSNDNGAENAIDSNIVTLSIMGMNHSSIVPVWSSENEKLLDSHQRQGFIRLDDQNLKRNPSYLLGVKQVVDCCEYLNNNSNFLTSSNPYEENQDVINLDIFVQYILQNLLVSEVNIVSSFVEKDKTRYSISHQLLFELEKTILASPYLLHIDIVKITNRYDLGILSVPITSNDRSNGITFNDRVIFDGLEQFLKRIRSKKCNDFTFSIGIGKSDIVKTNKELEYNLSKCFSLFTINPKLRSNSLSFYEEAILINPLSDFVYHL